MHRILQLKLLVFSFVVLASCELYEECSEAMEECVVPDPLTRDIYEVFKNSDNLDPEFFDRNDTHMGPIHVWCEQVQRDGTSHTLYKRAFGNWPQGSRGESTGVAIRSLSKIYVSIALLALFKHPEAKAKDLSLNTKFGEVSDLSGCNKYFGEATIRELLSMNYTVFDNRIAAIANRDEKGTNIDHVGWPPKCDVESKTIKDCLEEYVCKMYEKSPEELGIDSVEDTSCNDKYDKCEPAAKQGVSFTRHRAMMQFCPSACGLYCCDQKSFEKTCMMMRFDRTLCKTAKDENGRLIALHGCKKTCKVCSSEEEAKRYGYHFSFDHEKHQLYKKIRRDCIYENYGYTFLDYMIEKATGKNIAYWIKELILEPLDMQTSMHCMGMKEYSNEGEAPECYEPPKDIEDHIYVSKWPKQKSLELHSQNWISNALISSPKDLMTLSLMLMNNGTWNGREIINKDEVDAIFTGWNSFPLGGNCMGTQEFGLGAGYCRYPEPSPQEIISSLKKTGRAPEMSTSLCAEKDFWTWAGSYGSRFLYFRDHAIACTAVTNQNTIPTRSTKTRISSRSHITGHMLAAAIRKHFPASQS